MTRLRERARNAAARGADPIGAGGRGARYALSPACPKAMAMATDVTPERRNRELVCRSSFEEGRLRGTLAGEGANTSEPDRCVALGEFFVCRVRRLKLSRR